MPVHQINAAAEKVVPGLLAQEWAMDHV